MGDREELDRVLADADVARGVLALRPDYRALLLAVDGLATDPTDPTDPTEGA